jgi:hypothetical protein
VVQAPSQTRDCLAKGEATLSNPTVPLTTVGSEKPDHPVPETGLFNFYSFEQGLLVSVRFVWQ